MGRWRFLFWLFGVNLRISTFTFGGGYIVIPMMRRAFVEEKALYSENELMDMVAISQSSPGAIAINLSFLTDLRAAGMAGAVVSCIGAIVRPLVILSIISLVYVQFRDSTAVQAVLRGMQAGVAAMIVDLVVTLCGMIFGRRHWLSTLLVPAVFVASMVFRINIGLVLVGSTALAAAEAWIAGRRADHA